MHTSPEAAIADMARRYATDQTEFSLSLTSLIVGQSINTLRRRIKSGHLKADHAGRTYVITRENLENYMRAEGIQTL